MYTVGSQNASSFVVPVRVFVTKVIQFWKFFTQQGSYFMPGTWILDCFWGECTCSTFNIYGQITIGLNVYCNYVKQYIQFQLSEFWLIISLIVSWWTDWFDHVSWIWIHWFDHVLGIWNEWINDYGLRPSRQYFSHIVAGLWIWMDWFGHVSWIWTDWYDHVSWIWPDWFYHISWIWTHMYYEMCTGSYLQR